MVMLIQDDCGELRASLQEATRSPDFVVLQQAGAAVSVIRSQGARLLMRAISSPRLEL